MMIGMTPKRKIAVSLPADLVDAVKRSVSAGRAPNVSAFVADALADKVEAEDLSWLDELLDETGGPLTDHEREWLDEVFGRTGSATS